MSPTDGWPELGWGAIGTPRGRIPGAHAVFRLLPHAACLVRRQASCVDGNVFISVEQLTYGDMRLRSSVGCSSWRRLLDSIRVQSNVGPKTRSRKTINVAKSRGPLPKSGDSTACRRCRPAARKCDDNDDIRSARAGADGRPTLRFSSILARNEVASIVEQHVSTSRRQSLPADERHSRGDGLQPHAYSDGRTEERTDSAVRWLLEKTLHMRLSTDPPDLHLQHDFYGPPPSSNPPSKGCPVIQLSRMRVTSCSHLSFASFVIIMS